MLTVPKPQSRPNNAQVAARERTAVREGPQDAAPAQEVEGGDRQEPVSLHLSPREPSGEPPLPLAASPVEVDEEPVSEAVTIHHELSEEETVAAFRALLGQRERRPSIDVEQKNAPVQAQLDAPGAVALPAVPVANAVNFLADLPDSVLLDVLPLLGTLDLNDLSMICRAMRTAMKDLPSELEGRMQSARKIRSELQPYANSMATVMHLEAKASQLTKKPVSAVETLRWALTAVPRALELRQLRDAISHVQRARYGTDFERHMGPGMWTNFINALIWYHGLSPSYGQELKECDAYSLHLMEAHYKQEGIPAELHDGGLALMNRVGMDSAGLRAAFVQNSPQLARLEIGNVRLEIITRAMREYSQLYGKPDFETKRAS